MTCPNDCAGSCPACSPSQSSNDELSNASIDEQVEAFKRAYISLGIQATLASKGSLIQ